MISQLEKWPYLLRALLFALTAFLFTLALSSSDVFQRMELDLSDAHNRLIAPKVNFENVVVIDVDEESIIQLLPKIGAWPYDREIYALVVNWLKSTGVRAIGVDILFSEPRKGDDALAEALDERVVLAAAALPFSFERDSVYHAQLAKKSWGLAPPAGAYMLKDLTLPRAQLTARAGIGVISAPVDSDGILRRVPLVFSAYGQLAPSLALALAQVGNEKSLTKVDNGKITTAGRSWPVSSHAEVRLRYPASLDSIRTVPFYQVALAASGVAGLEPLGASLRGKRVVIGSSSAALGDYVETPLGRQPGVRMQAMVAQLIGGGHVLKPQTVGVEISMMVGALLLVMLMGHPRWQSKSTTQWVVFPLVIILVGTVAAIVTNTGQAVGLLIAISAAFFAHFLGMLFRQVQLYRQNQQLELEKRAALQADALKSQFLSHITHELRTPLTAIMGFNNINWHSSDLGRDQRMKNSETVDRNCQHMLALVNNLLDQAKLNSGQLTIKRHLDNPQTVVVDAVATVEPLLRGKAVKLRIDDVGVPEVLDIDAFRLRQILLNLLSNAIKFTDTGEISVVSAWQEGELTLSVVDTGPGMSEDTVKQLFTAFHQADAGVAAKHGGTGLGLTISRDLARLMGGDIKVHSKLGQGSVFTVTIAALRPEVASESPALQTTESRAVEALATKLLQGVVLVAEDMTDTRALVVRHLEQLGLTVLQVENGEQAIEMALSKRPDVVLMDMDMPLIAGFEATRTLRMCGFSAPVLALTAHKGLDEQTRALAAGCNSIIEKPLTRVSLLTALSAALAPNVNSATTSLPSTQT